MTPDQALKAAIMGDDTDSTVDPVSEPRKRGAKTPRQAASREKTPRKKPSRLFRWTIRILFVVLTLLITRGLLQTPEIQAMLQDAKTAVLDFAQKEGKARDKAAAAEALRAARAAQQPQSPEMPADVGAKVSDMPGNSDNVRATTPEVSATSHSGPVTAIRAGNVLDVADITLVINNLACAAPDTDPGRTAALALARLTRAQTLSCEITGVVKDHILKADCRLRNDSDIATQMKSDGLCS